MPNTDLIFDKKTPARGNAQGRNTSGIQVKALPVIALVVIIAIAALGAYALVPKNKSSLYALKTWSEATVTQVTMRNLISASGVIELKNKETLLAPQTSQVSAVFVKEGDTVTKGQPIAQLVTDDLEWNLVVAQSSLDQLIRDSTMADTEYGFTVRQQDINLKTAERNVRTAQENLEKIQGLFERNIASVNELTNAKNAVADAGDALELALLNREQTDAKYRIAVSNRETSVAQKRKEIADLKEAIAACTVRSASSGRVYALSVAVGDRVSSFASIAVIANPKDIQVGIDIAENRINDVKLGDAVRVTIGSSAFAGRVSTIASSATSSSSSSTSTVRVNAEFDSIPETAIVGGSVTTEVQVGILENALSLPRGPYLSSGNYNSVYVIQKDGRAVKKNVSFGITDGSLIQVLSGLGRDDRIITSAYQEYIHLDEIALEK